MYRRLLPGLLLLALIPLLLFALLANADRAASQVVGAAESDSCDVVRWLRAEDVIPYELESGGGVLTPGVQRSSTMLGAQYYDVWVLNARLPRNAGGFPIASTLTLRLDRVASNLNLEVGVFAGAAQLNAQNAGPGYLPVRGEQTLIYPLNADGFYTIVVRRQDPRSRASGNYALTADFDGGDEIVLPNLRDNSTNQPLTTPPSLTRGRQLITFDERRILTHAGAANSVASYLGAASQVRLGAPEDDFGVYFNNWAKEITLLGGDLAVRGVASDGQPRTFYVQDYGYRINMLDGELGNVTDSNGTRWRLNWQVVQGVWILRDCAGFRLGDGTTFVGHLTPGSRDLTFQGDVRSFTIRMVQPIATVVNPVEHTVTMSWQGVQPRSEVRLMAGVFEIDLLAARRLRLQARQIDLRRRATFDPQPQHVPLDIRLIERDTSLTLDWRGLMALELINNALTLTFVDENRQPTTRSAANLEQFESLDGAIRMVFQDPVQGIAGEERLLLPAEESYIEIVTPPGMPIFDGRDLPGELRYMPRALNNTGGECYPINTLQPQANCPPNGHINPANGNLWYAVTDHSAAARSLDLALTRSYNSALAAVDGPFGFGWTSPFLVDYVASYNPVTSSRLIDQNASRRYPVSLDLTWAPRGVVTFTTASGSRHVFAAANNRFQGGTLTAITMPGWTLSRRDIHDRAWTLEQSDGLTYTFDRAGRLVSYGYPLEQHLVTIDYPRDMLEGPAGLGRSQPVIITDAPDQRRLELYYDGPRVVRSVLRDLTVYADGETPDPDICEADANCYEVRYAYEDGYLVRVDYPDGGQANYTYDEAGRLIAHDDPRAPVAPVARYAYADDGGRVATVVQPGLGEEFVWQQIDAPVIDNAAGTRAVTVTDEFNSRRTYIYAWQEGTLKAAGESFTLLSETSPLSQVIRFETEPIRYNWVNGLLERTQARLVGENTGRNSVVFEYRDGTHISRIRSGYPGFGVSYTVFEGELSGLLPQTLTFGDDTTRTFEYDARGRVSRMTDRGGGGYTYTWDNARRITSVTSEGDETITGYSYNSLGLVTEVARRRVDDSPDDALVIRYEYDGLGRLVGISDPLTGDYDLGYRMAESPAHVSIATTDPTGATLITTLDARGRLLERAVRAPDGEVLRRTTYTYDALGRMESESRWLYPLPGESSEEARPLTTRFDYRTVPVLPTQPGDGSTANRVINGYEITITDPYGRVERVAYDGLDRVRQVVDAFGRISRYDYDTTETRGNINGLRIIHREIVNNQLAHTSEYVFDLRWQLRAVTRDADPANDDPGGLWEFFMEGETTRLQALRARRAGIVEQSWSGYTYGRPTRVDISQSPQSLNSGTSLPAPTARAEYDFMGRPLSFTDGTGVTYGVVYCPLAQGGLQTVYALAGDSDPACDSPASLSVWQDAHGRLLRAEEASGSREYTYIATNGGWRVGVAFAHSSGQPVADWTLAYNSVGDLTRWVDEHGTVHDYSYDSLGRLRRMAVTDASGAPQPEMSFNFTYNDAGLLTAALDDLQRGTLYDYDSLGRLTVEQDARTANATIYGYNTEELLSSVISPLGNTTTYLYADPSNPLRLTGIIEPTGSTVEFDWDVAGGRLTYSDSRDNTTVYTFDSFGLLWRIDDALGRSHELHYNSGGHLTAWRQSQPAGDGSPARHLRLSRPGPYRLGVETASASVNWQRDYLTLPNGQVTAIVPQLSAEASGVLSFDYDPLGRLSGVQSTTTRWSLDYVQGEPLLIFGEGDETQHVLRFDALNRLLSHEVDGETTTYTYERMRSADVNVTVTRDGAETQVYTFASGDVSSRLPGAILRAPGRRTTYIYDAEGLLSEIVAETCVVSTPLENFDPLRPDECVRTNADDVWRVSERIVYDAQGRPIRYIDAEQNIATYAYDEGGNLVVYQNVNGKTFDYTYDALNRLESVIGPTGTRLLLRYNNLDRVTGVCRARAEDRGTYDDCVSAGGELETYTYDALGRLVTQTFPAAEGGQSSVRYRYEAADQGLLSGWGADERPGVTLNRSRDGADVLQSFSTGGTRYELAHTEGLQRLVQAGDITYSYDPYGRLAAVDVAGRRLVYEYSPTGFRVSDEASGDSIHFVLDERGLLTSINGDAIFDYFLNPDGRILVVQIDRGDGELIEIQLNRLGETINIAYSDSSLFADFVVDAAGMVQRKSLIGLAQYFEAEAGGYIVVIGYDNDDRPLTMRVNDRDTGRLLYLLNFTYDSVGQRVTETRQHGDIQTTITNIYGGYNQLIRRDVTTAMLSGAAGRASTQTFSYRYDNAGNLIEIATGDESARVCASYSYDGANRLVAVASGGETRRYRYDTHNRLSGIDDLRLVYHGDSDQVLAVYNADGTPRFYGQADGLSNLFQQTNDTTIWLLSDGRQGIMGALADGESMNSPVWLFDPLGRFLSLNAASANGEADPCAAPFVPPDLRDVSPLQTLQPGMVWDAATNLYFNGGRAYLPELGRFLQRDPLGPDVLGNVYSYPSRQTVPPVRHNPPAYQEGLLRLRDALADIRATRSLSANDVLRAYLPAHAPQFVEPLTPHLNALATPVQDRLVQQIDLPRWLRHNYNLPGAYIDSNGALRLPRDNAPGHGGLQRSLTLSNVRVEPSSYWLPTVVSPFNRLQGLVDLTHVSERPLVLYEPQAWLPPAPHISAAWNVTTPHLNPAHAPGAVWSWLPRRPFTPESGALALEITSMLDELPNRSGLDRLIDALDMALPRPPDLPPATSADWLANWFTDDTLGIAGTLGARWPDLGSTPAPVYHLGPNTPWP